MRFFLQLSYDGTNYHGWQRQPNVPSVQETIEQSLENVMGNSVHIMGCGRTDSGVHALKYYAHLELPELPKFDLPKRLNRVLPDDIAIHSMIEVSDTADAQIDAQSRTYLFRLHTLKEPFSTRYSSYYPIEKNALLRMKEAALVIGDYQDFSKLCRQPDLYKSTLCQISHVGFEINPEGTSARFILTSNRFLRGMMRLLLARLIEVGKNEISMDDWLNLLKGNMEMPFKHAAYPQGLHLMDVKYHYID